MYCYRLKVVKPQTTLNIQAKPTPVPLFWFQTEQRNEEGLKVLAKSENESKDNRGLVTLVCVCEPQGTKGHTVE